MLSKFDMLKPASFTNINLGVIVANFGKTAIRTAETFAYTFLGVFSFTDLSTAKGALIAGAVAATVGVRTAIGVQLAK